MLRSSIKNIEADTTKFVFHNFQVDLLIDNIKLRHFRLIGYPLRPDQIVSVCLNKLRGFYIECEMKNERSKEITMQEYFAVREFIGPDKMFVCRNLKVNEDIVQYMLDS